MPDTIPVTIDTTLLTGGDSQCITFRPDLSTEAASIASGRPDGRLGSAVELSVLTFWYLPRARRIGPLGVRCGGRGRFHQRLRLSLWGGAPSTRPAPTAQPAADHMAAGRPAVAGAKGRFLGRVLVACPPREVVRSRWIGHVRGASRDRLPLTPDRGARPDLVGPDRQTDLGVQACGSAGVTMFHRLIGDTSTETNSARKKGARRCRLCSYNIRETTNPFRPACPSPSLV
jgi:hypothetical protein